MKKFKLIHVLGVAMIGLASFSSCTDACDDVVCQNGGTCIDGDCECPDGYTGTNCETEERAQFIGAYSLDETCPSGPITGWSTSIASSATGVTKIAITGFGGFQCNGSDIVVIATVNGSDVTIDANQSFCSGATTIDNGSGSMNASGNVLSVTYTYSQGGASETCTGTYTKQ